MNLRMNIFLTFLLFAASLVALIIISSQYYNLEVFGVMFDRYSISGLIIFLVLSIIVEFNTIPHISGQGKYSMGGEVDRATVVLFGPFWATGIVLATYLFSFCVNKGKNIQKLVFNISQFTLTLGLTGLTFIAAKGKVGEHNFPHLIIPLLLSVTVYILVNKSLVCFYWSLKRNENFISLWRKNFQWRLVSEYASIPFSILIIYLYDVQHLLGLLFIFGPFYLLYKSYMIYTTLKENYKETITALVDIIEASDPYTSGHSKRVATYSKKLAEALKLRYKEIDDIEMAATLHDIGKIGREFQDILNKPSSLNPEELKLMHSHPTISFNLISRITFLKKINKVVLHHHELYDGSGKPDGLSGEEIPLGARIIAVADAFDAMTSDRPYRKALPLSYAINELKKFSGIQFDPYLVEVWLEKCMPQEEEIHALKFQEVEAKVPG